MQNKTFKDHLWIWIPNGWTCITDNRIGSGDKCNSLKMSLAATID